MIRLFRRFINSPARIGSIAPSSKALAAEMVRQIGRTTAVFEIGAGTGAITRHIQKAALSRPLNVFEQDRMLAEHLRCRITSARVIEGLFHDMVHQLGEIPEDLVILSSLPFKSLPRRLHHDTVEALCRLLLDSPQRRLVQFTYFDRHPFVPHDHRLHWRRLSRVWANIPPAIVWELRVETGRSLAPS